MGKRHRSKKSRGGPQPGKRSAKTPGARYTAGEIAMAVLGAAILIMVAGIVITSILE